MNSGFVSAWEEPSPSADSTGVAKSGSSYSRTSEEGSGATCSSKDLSATVRTCNRDGVKDQKMTSEGFSVIQQEEPPTKMTVLNCQLANMSFVRPCLETTCLQKP